MMVKRKADPIRAIVDRTAQRKNEDDRIPKSGPNLGPQRPKNSQILKRIDLSISQDCIPFNVSSSTKIQ
jgi:hypothetical protein